MAKFFNTYRPGHADDVEVLASSSFDAFDGGKATWHVVGYPMFSSFDPAKQISYFWAFAIKNADGSYRRNETMLFSTKDSRQDVIDWCIASGYTMLAR